MNNELLKLSIEAISQQRPIITVPSDRSLADAFTILTRNNIYSAPIYNEATKEVTGFIDMMDIVMYITKIIEEQQTDATDDETPLDRKDIYELMEQVRQFEYAKLSSASDISKRNPICTISHDAPLREALKIFENLHTRKLLVLQNPWTIKNVLSQSDVVVWLGKLLSDEGPQGMQQPIGAIAHKKIKDVFNMGAKVLSVRGEVQALEAFKLMAHHNVSAVAVLNEDGTLLSTLTAKDIKVIDKDALFTKLYKPSREFVGLARSSVKTQYPYYFCHPDDTVEQVIQKLSLLRVHRIFVIDADKKPISVISLCDILHAISL